MSLKSLTSGHTVTLQRPTTSQDSSGGPVREPFVNVTGAVDIHADIQPASSGTIMAYGQRNITVTHQIYLTQDVGAKAGYRFISGARKFVVQGYVDEVGRGRLWVADVQEFLK